MPHSAAASSWISVIGRKQTLEGNAPAVRVTGVRIPSGLVGRAHCELRASGAFPGGMLSSITVPFSYLLDYEFL